MPAGRTDTREFWEHIAVEYEATGDRRDRKDEYEEAARFACSPLLEVGCAYGAFADYLSIACQYVGIDISGRMIKAARERRPERLFARADIRDVDPVDWEDAFGTVAAFQLVEHFSGDALKALMEKLIRMARKNILISVPRGLQTEKQKTVQGHVSEWANEYEFADTFGAYGEVQMMRGRPEHICGMVVLNGG